MKVILIILIYIIITLIVTKIYFNQIDYFTTKYGYRCASCPLYSKSRPGSKEQTDCKCDVGFTGPDGGDCIPCQAGKYKNSTGSSVCQDCGAGTYQDELGSQTCKPCDSDCETGKYLNGCGGGNAGNCIGCPENSTTTDTGSDSIEDCKCNVGYSGPNGGLCTPCLAGTYKDSIGSSVCQDCGAGTYQDELGSQTCKPCDSRCGANQYIVGCGGVDDGTCMDNWGVMSCGFNHYGELGFNSDSKERGRQYHEDEDEDTNELYEYHIVPVSVPTIETEFTITQIVCGCNYSLFLTTEGRVYSCGYNFKGQIGIGTSNRGSVKKTPTLIETYYGYNDVSINYDAITITQIASGESHCLFLTHEGRVYSCGYNFYGQLGIGTSRSDSDKNTPKLIETYAYNGGSLNYDAIRITQIAGGGYYSLFLTSDGYVFSCGYNEFGQLGIGTSRSGSDKNTPTLIETYYGYNDVSINFDVIRITQIACGDYHSLFLTSDGHVFSCGSNFEGQLGLGTSDWGRGPNTPKLIETYYGYNDVSINYDAIAITQIACCFEHSLFLTEGRVYSCGYNYSGQLGIGTSDWGSDINTPTLIETYYGYNDVSINYDAITITQIACGYYHSLFLTSDGYVYSSGNNFYGQLGIGTGGSGSSKNTPKLIETYYGYSDESINYDVITITQIACGYYHTLFLTDERNSVEIDNGNEVE